MTDSAQRHRELVRVRSALGIVHAHYWRALTLAEHARGFERAAAFKEVRRLTAIAVALRRRLDALQAAETSSSPTSGHRGALRRRPRG